MPDAGLVLTAVRQELINAALVRAPSVAGARVPAHIEPVDGAVAPGDRTDARTGPSVEEAGGPDTPVVSLFFDGDVAPATFGSDRTTVVSVRYRAMTSAGVRAVHALDAAIRRRLVERDDPALAGDGRFGLGYFMGAGSPGLPAGGLWVRQASVYGGLSRLSATKETGWDLVAKYAIEVDA